jgi:hypothetical protein
VINQHHISSGVSGSKAESKRGVEFLFVFQEKQHLCRHALEENKTANTGVTGKSTSNKNQDPYFRRGKQPNFFAKSTDKKQFHPVVLRCLYADLLHFKINRQNVRQVQ